MSHVDNRQRFNINVVKSLVLAHIERRVTVSSHHESIEQNIACVLKSLRPEPDQAALEPPAKSVKTYKAARKQRSCSFCPVNECPKRIEKQGPPVTLVIGPSAKIILCSSATDVQVVGTHDTDTKMCILIKKCYV